MQQLEFLNRLMDNKLAINPARVLLFIHSNPSCQQKNMLEPLKMSRAVLSQCCTLLVNRKLIYQGGSYVSKTHDLTNKGLKVIKLITSTVETDFTENDATVV